MDTIGETPLSKAFSTPMNPLLGPKLPPQHACFKWPSGSVPVFLKARAVTSQQGRMESCFQRLSSGCWGEQRGFSVVRGSSCLQKHAWVG